MDDHFELNDAEFEVAFSKGTLSPTLFDHEAHLRLAWIHINKYGIDSAIDNICVQLKDYVVQHGVADKFNATVTIAAIRAVYHFKLKSESNNFCDFIQEFPKLKNNFKELLGCHYITDIFNSTAARKNYIEPELLPFD